MKYVQPDSNGNIIAFYDDSINSVAQIGTAIKITDAQWQDCINNPNKWMIVAGALQLTPAPTAEQLLATAKTSQLTVLAAGYQTAIVQPVSYASVGGVTKKFQADAGSVANVQATLAGLSKAGATPTGFYWVSADNTQVPFSYADIQGLAAAMLSQGWSAFAHLQAQKAIVNASSTVSAVQGVVW
jgi:hypothetical protein